MRLQLMVVVAVFVAASGRAMAQPYVSIDTRGSVYQDTDDTTIITTAAAATVTPVEHLSVNGGYLADIVSSASVDVVSAATERWDEVRHEGHGGLGYQDADRALSGNYVYSVENDWRSHSGSLTFSHDLADHMVTLGATAAFTHNAVGRADDVNFEEELLQGSGTLESTFVLSKNDLFATSYTLQVLEGYQASPYRFVRFAGPISGVPISEPENHPDLRLRHALGVRWNRYLWTDSVLRSTLRGYLDNWGIVSATATLELVVGFVEVLEIAPFVRGYVQSAARFYREVYAERLEHMTADRELSAFVDGFGGLRFGYLGTNLGPFQELRADVKGTVMAFRFFDYALLEHREGIIGELGIGASF